MPITRRNRSARKIQRRYRMYLRMKRKKPTSGRGVTFEHDRQFIYGLKTMPRKKKMRWRKFNRKVNAVSEKDLGSRTVVFNKSVTFDNNTDGDQLLADCALYSGVSASKTYFNDLKNISSYENTGDPTSAAGGTVARSTKFIFQSAVLDITMRNTSDKNDGNLDGDATLEVDLYEVLIKRDKSESSGTFATTTSFFAKGSTDTGNIGGAGTEITLGKRGCTPWDVPFALSFARIKILKKTKMFIRSGNTSTYQLRDPGRRVFSREAMEDLVTCNKRGVTRHVLIIAKAVPGITIGPTSGTETRERLQIGITRKYLYKIEGFNEDRDRYLANT
jgi:hypothetical protein